MHAAILRFRTPWLVLSVIVLSLALALAGSARSVHASAPPSLSAEEAVAVAEGAEGTATTADIDVSVSSTGALPVSVWYNTWDGTATAADGDYMPVMGGVLVIPTGVATGTIHIIVNGDDLYEPDETFTLTLYNAVMAGTSTPVDIIQTTTVVTIVNDDPAPDIDVSPPDLALTLDRNASSTSTLSITNNGTGTLVFEIDVVYGGPPPATTSVPVAASEAPRPSGKSPLDPVELRELAEKLALA